MSNAMDWFAQKWCKDEERSYVHDYKDSGFKTLARNNWAKESLVSCMKRYV